MSNESAYTLFSCNCHPTVNMVAPRYEGERHYIAYPRYYPPGQFPAEETEDEYHRLVARNGKWEIAE